MTRAVEMEKLSGEYSPSSQKHVSRSILESFHPLAMFGQFCGFLPIKNVLVGLHYTLENSAFQLFSYPVLYSIILNILIYVFSLEATLGYWTERRTIFIFSTDAFAIQTFLAVFILLRFTFHLLCIFGSPKVLECLKQLEAYDKFYKLENETKVVNKYFLFYLVGTIVNIVGNVFATYPELIRTICQNNGSVNGESEKRNSYLIYNLIPSAKILSVLAYGFHVIAELALFFSHCCITFIITAICDRVSAITTQINEIAKDNNCSFVRMPTPFPTDGSNDSSPQPPSDDTPIDHVTVWIKQIAPIPIIAPAESFLRHCNNAAGAQGKFGILKSPGKNQSQNQNEERNEVKTVERLKSLCSQYMSLLKINRGLSAYAKETVTVFTAGSAVMLVSLCYLICILLTQYVPVKRSRIKESVEIVPIIFVALITFLRLLNFINTGEKLRRDGYELRTAIHRLYSPDLGMSPVITYFQQVTSTLQLNLDAGGFFIVRRSVISAIIGPVMTFIVILVQFRAADLQLHHSYTNQSSET